MCRYPTLIASATASRQASPRNIQAPDPKAGTRSPSRVMNFIGPRLRRLEGRWLLGDRKAVSRLAGRSWTRHGSRIVFIGRISGDGRGCSGFRHRPLHKASWGTPAPGIIGVGLKGWWKKLRTRGEGSTDSNRSGGRGQEIAGKALPSRMPESCLSETGYGIRMATCSDARIPPGRTRAGNQAAASQPPRPKRCSRLGCLSARMVPTCISSRRAGIETNIRACAAPRHSRSWRWKEETALKEKRH